MRHLRFTLLGLALLLPFGCSGDKTEENDKSPEKTTENAAENTKTGEAQNASAQNTPAKNTASKTLRTSDGTAFGMVPQNASLLVSVSPSSLLKSEFFQALPIEGDQEFEREMAQMKSKAGFDLRGIASVSLAVWEGDGHLNSLPQLLGAFGGGGGPPIEQQFPEPEFPEFDDCNVQPPEDFGPGGPGGPGGGMAGQILQQLEGSLPKFDGAVFLRFNQPVDVAQLQKNLEPLKEVEQQDFEGQTVWVHPAVDIAGGASLYQPDSQSLIITFKDDLKDILHSSGKGTLVTQAATQGAEADFTFMLDFSPFQKLIAEAGDQIPPGPGRLITQLTGISLFVDANTGIDVDAYVGTNDQQVAQQIQGLAGSEMVKQQLQSQVTQQSGNLSEETQAEAKKLGQSITDSIKAEVEGTQFHFSLRVPENAPAVFQKIQQETVKRMQGQNNLKQIGLAFFNYHDVYNQFPFPTGKTDDGKPSQLSWRVHILPYIEEEALYEQFKLDEPWDSEHNKALLDKMPDVFKLSDQTKAGHTQFVAPTGEGFIIDGDKTRKIRDLTDGLSNTVIVLSVQPEKAVPWTKPGGFSLDPAKAAEILQNDGGKFLALYGDGSVRNISTQIEAETLKALLTISGGEVVDLPE